MSFSPSATTAAGKLAESPPPLSRPIRTEKRCPSLHSMTQDLGKLYDVSASPSTSSVLNEFSEIVQPLLRPEFARQLKFFEDCSLLIRRPALQIIACLNQLQAAATSPSAPSSSSGIANQHVIRFVVWGKEGVGKSVTSSHVLHAAHRLGYLLLPFHDLETQLHFTREHCQQERTPPHLLRNQEDHQQEHEQQQHEHEEELFDTPLLAQQWLTRFARINAHILSSSSSGGGEFLLSKSVVWNERERLEADGATTWSNLIEFGVSRPKYANAALHALLCEVKRRQHPALLYIDSMNQLYKEGAKSRLCNPLTRRHIPLQRFSIVQSLRSLLDGDGKGGGWANGVALCVTNQRAAYLFPEDAQPVSHFPRNLIGEEGWRQLEPNIPIHVDRLSHAELANYLRFLDSHAWLHNRGFFPTSSSSNVSSSDSSFRIYETLQFRELCFLSDQNALEVFNLTQEW